MMLLSTDTFHPGGYSLLIISTGILILGTLVIGCGKEGAGRRPQKLLNSVRGKNKNGDEGGNGMKSSKQKTSATLRNTEEEDSKLSQSSGPLETGPSDADKEAEDSAPTDLASIKTSAKPEPKQQQPSKVAPAPAPSVTAKPSTTNAPPAQPRREEVPVDTFYENADLLKKQSVLAKSPTVTATAVTPETKRAPSPAQDKPSPVVESEKEVKKKKDAEEDDDDEDGDESDKESSKKRKKKKSKKKKKSSKKVKKSKKEKKKRVPTPPAAPPPPPTEEKKPAAPPPEPAITYPYYLCKPVKDDGRIQEPGLMTKINNAMLTESEPVKNAPEPPLPEAATQAVTEVRRVSVSRNLDDTQKPTTTKVVTGVSLKEISLPSSEKSLPLVSARGPVEGEQHITLPSSFSFPTEGVSGGSDGRSPFATGIEKSASRNTDGTQTLANVASLSGIETTQASATRTGTTQLSATRIGTTQHSLTTQNNTLSVAPIVTAVQAPERPSPGVLSKRSASTQDITKLDATQPDGNSGVVDPVNGGSLVLKSAVGSTLEKNMMKDENAEWKTFLARNMEQTARTGELDVTTSKSMGVQNTQKSATLDAAAAKLSKSAKDVKAPGPNEPTPTTLREVVSDWSYTHGAREDEKEVKPPPPQSPGVVKKDEKVAVEAVVPEPPPMEVEKTQREEKPRQDEKLSKSSKKQKSKSSKPSKPKPEAEKKISTPSKDKLTPSAERVVKQEKEADRVKELRKYAPKPKVFKRNSYEEKIAKGHIVRKRHDYPTMNDVASDWDTEESSNTAPGTEKPDDNNHPSKKS